MPFETERKALDSGIVVLALSGTMTMGNQLQQLEWTVGELTKNKQSKIVLDMTRVTFIDSSAIGVLAACYGNVSGAGGHLRVAGVCDRVLTILRMVKVDTFLPLDATADASVSAMAATG